MRMIRLLIDEKAKGKGRPRFTTRGKFVRTYTPKDTLDFCNKVRNSFIETFGDEYKDYEGAVKIDILCCYSVPKSLSEKKKKQLLYKPFLKKPDNDNIEKSIMDALNGVAYKDDSQVYENHTIKKYNKDDFIMIEIIYEDLI